MTVLAIVPLPDVRLISKSCEPSIRNAVRPKVRFPPEISRKPAVEVVSMRKVPVFTVPAVTRSPETSKFVVVELLFGANGVSDVCGATTPASTVAK